AHQEHDPCPRPNAPDADDLAGRMDVSEPLEQAPSVALQGASIAADGVVHESLDRIAIVALRDVLDGDDQGWVGDDPRLTVDHRGQLVERAQAVLRASLREVLVQSGNLL